MARVSDLRKMKRSFDDLGDKVELVIEETKRQKTVRMVDASTNTGKKDYEMTLGICQHCRGRFTTRRLGEHQARCVHRK